MATNTLVMGDAHMSVLGVLPVISLIKFEPFQLEHDFRPLNNGLKARKTQPAVQPATRRPRQWPHGR
jgi:hypothetical protein